MRKMIVFLAIVLASCLVLVVVALAANWSTVRQFASFSPIILPNFGPAPANEAEARSKDIEHLGRLLDYDRSFDETARKQFEELVANSKQEAATMSPAQLYLLAAEASALADNGHTGISPTPLQSDFNAVGVRYFHFLDGLYVVRALTEHEQLIGGRVLEIDGQPIEAILTALNAYFGGTEGWRQLHAIVWLEFPEILHAAGLTESPGGYTLTVQDEAGSRHQVELRGLGPPGADSIHTYWPWKALQASALADEGEEWARSLQPIPEDLLPLYLQQPDERFLWTPLQDGGYLRLQAITNSKSQSISAFFAEEIEPLPNGSLRYLVVDLRANGGGDFKLLADIVKWLPAKVAEDGHLYIVVGPQTFSAAIISAAMLKYYGGEKSAIIGSPMGDREQFWAEWGMPFRLPSSGFEVHYATGYHDWENGCTEHPYCFTPVLEHGVAAGSLTPDHMIVAEYADYAAGRDVVMEWVHDRELP